MTDRQKLQNIKNRVIAVNSQNILGVLSDEDYQYTLECLSNEIAELEKKYEKRGIFGWKKG